MSPSEQTAFRLDADILEGLRTLKERDGTPYNTAANRALREWLTAKGVIKVERKKEGRLKRVK